MASVAKVIFNNKAITDVTGDTVNKDTLMGGFTALGADGEVVQGGAKEDHENDIIQGTLGGTYTNATLYNIGYTGLMRVTNNQSEPFEANLPNVSYVGWAGMYANSQLTSVNLPNCKKVESLAFQLCSNLTSVSLPAVSIISDRAFTQCSALPSFVAGSSCVTIGQSAFQSCTSLETVTLPAATVIGSSAFQTCTNLTTIDFPNVSKLHDNAFNGCSNLTSLTLPYVCSPGATTFINCRKISYWVHDSTGIYTTCFQNCYNLKAVDVSTTFNATRQSMFSNCSSLSVFIIRKNAVVALSHTNCFVNTPFASGKTGGALYVPSAYIASYKAATNWATILGYSTNQTLPIEGSDYEYFFADGTPINDKPMHPLDGEYSQESNGTTTITIEDGHWHIVHESSGGNGSVILYQFTFDQIGGTHTYRTEISNFVCTSQQTDTTIDNQSLGCGNQWGQGFTLWSVPSGDGSYSTEITQNASNVEFKLTWNVPWTRAYDIEFDAQIYLDGVWYF